LNFRPEKRVTIFDSSFVLKASPRVDFAHDKGHRMKFSLIELSLILKVLAAYVDAAMLRGFAPQPIRYLEEIRDFVPLGCNANIGTAVCESWTSKFGTNDEHSNRITIDCGQCITMDHGGETLSLLDGLEIYGKLVFPDGYKLEVETTMLSVQGELEMTALKPVDGSPQVIFTMIGDDDETFTPIGENIEACDGERMCSTGKRGIVVAGGRVNRK